MDLSMIKGLRFIQFGLILVSAFQLSGSIAAGAQDPVKNPSEVCSLSHLKDTARFEDYVFRTYERKESGEVCFQILRQGKVLFRRTNDNGGWFSIGQKADDRDKIPAIPSGTDVTGRGHPDMVIGAYSGGAHCCLTHYVFELEPQFKLLATLNVEDSWPAYFAELDEDHHYYYMANDWSFAYWPSSFAGSPTASVVLHWVDDLHEGGFHLALNKMRKPAPTAEELDVDLKEARAILRDGAPSDVGPLWSTVLNLIYTGHSELAWRFVDDLGPKAFQGPFADVDLEAFCMILKSSPYWADLEPSLRSIPPTCANAKRARK